MGIDAERDVVVRLADIVPGSDLEKALQLRADVMEMTQATHDAALTPTDCGGLSHAERAALAARVARLNGDDMLARHYDALLDTAGADAAERLMADPANSGDAGTRNAAIVAFTDLVSMHTRDAGRADIKALQAAGIDDADIVRLAELNAFLAYQIRLIAGLKLMRGAA